MIGTHKRVSMARCLLCIVTIPCIVALAPSIQFRAGRKGDELPIAITLGKELMNPLGISSDRFLIAQDEDCKEMIGFVQIKPLGSAKRNPAKYDARPDAEQDVDESIREESEKDETPFPPGWAFPWTKAFRDYTASSNARQKPREESVKGEKRSESKLWELASVFVVPEYRGQGIGTELVRQALERHVDEGRVLSDVYLLTLKTTIDWYRDNFGFELVPEKEIPQQMLFEVAAGKIVTSFLGAELCCMRGPSKLKK